MSTQKLLEARLREEAELARRLALKNRCDCISCCLYVIVQFDLVAVDIRYSRTWWGGWYSWCLLTDKKNISDTLIYQPPSVLHSFFLPPCVLCKLNVTHHIFIDLKGCRCCFKRRTWGTCFVRHHARGGKRSNHTAAGWAIRHEVRQLHSAPSIMIIKYGIYRIHVSMSLHFQHGVA